MSGYLRSWRNRFGVVVVTSLLLGALAGCGSDDSDAETTASSAPPSSVAPANDASDDAGTDPDETSEPAADTESACDLVDVADVALALVEEVEETATPCEFESVSGLQISVTTPVDDYDTALAAERASAGSVADFAVAEQMGELLEGLDRQWYSFADGRLLVFGELAGERALVEITADRDPINYLFNSIALNKFVLGVDAEWTPVVRGRSYLVWVLPYLRNWLSSIDAYVGLLQGFQGDPATLNSDAIAQSSASLVVTETERADRQLRSAISIDEYATERDALGDAYQAYRQWADSVIQCRGEACVPLLAQAEDQKTAFIDVFQALVDAIAADE